jgi:hypothetical protein
MPESTTNLLVFLAIVTARLAIPLLIPRFPLPAILACMIIDGVDQTIFQQFTTIDLTNYQSYDKALDIYYLSVAYLATLRNWWNLDAFKVSRFLYYYRLVIFEVTQVRAILLIFPNTFEYFFDFYEAVRTRWNPKRMSKRFVILAAAAIWIFIKLPQEWWIHVAQLDVTDTMRAYPTATVILAVVALVVAYIAWRVLWPKTPPADWPWTVDADAQGADVAEEEVARTRQRLIGRLFDEQLIEKFVMVALVSAIFSRILPGVQASALQLTSGVAVLVVVNTAVSAWLARRGTTWRSIVTEFLAMTAINFGTVVLFSLLLRSGTGSLHIGNALFFVFLLTLLVTLYDRFRAISLARFGEGQSLRAGL